MQHETSDKNKRGIMSEGAKKKMKKGKEKKSNQKQKKKTTTTHEAALTRRVLSLHQWLNDVQDRLQSLPDLSIFRLNGFILFQGRLQVEERFLGGEIAHALLEGIDVRLGPLTDGSLSLAIVGALLCQLLRGKVGNASSRRAVQLALPPRRPAIIGRRRFCVCRDQTGRGGRIL